MNRPMSLRRSELLCHSRLLLPVIEVLHVKSTSTPASGAKMKDVFDRFGFPGEIGSDNGTQFASSEFRSFAETRWLALMIYRDTVISATGHSPIQLLISRHVKTNLQRTEPTSLASDRCVKRVHHPAASTM